MEARTAKIGLLLFLATEVMFFAGLVAAYWVLRVQVVPWPPPDQPRLPVLVTGINTLILLLSGVTVSRAEHAIGRQTCGRQTCGRRGSLIGWLGMTGGIGLLFLLVQGYEWVRLIRFGLRTAHNIYGGIFYLVVGAHGVHLLAALVVLGIVLLKSVRGLYSPERAAGLSLVRIYWWFVVGIWPILYGVVYLL